MSDFCQIVDQQGKQLVLRADVQLREQVALVNHHRTRRDAQFPGHRLGGMPPEKELADLALGAFRLTGCQVWGRVDLIRAQNGDWQLLEVNTVPGMTSHSLVPMAARAADLTLLELLTEIFRVSEEVRRYEA